MIKLFGSQIFVPALFLCVTYVSILFYLQDLLLLRDAVVNSNKSRLCPEDLDAFKNWKPDINVDQVGFYYSYFFSSK